MEIRNIIPFAFIAVLILIAGFSCNYYIQEKNKCDDKGGTLVKDAFTNEYKCVRSLP